MESNLSMTILKAAGMLFVVLGFMIAVLYLMKRFTDKKFGVGAPGVIKTLATHYITPKEKILLIEVMGERLLIGSTPQNLNFIATMKNADEFQFPEEKKPDFFKNILSKALKKEEAVKEE